MQAVHSIGCRVTKHDNLTQRFHILSNWVHLSDSVVADHGYGSAPCEIVRLHLQSAPSYLYEVTILYKGVCMLLLGLVYYLYRIQIRS